MAFFDERQVALLQDGEIDGGKVFEKFLKNVVVLYWIRHLPAAIDLHASGSSDKGIGRRYVVRLFSISFVSFVFR